MSKFLLILLLLPMALQADCLKPKDLKVSDGIRLERDRHILIFTNDSCGARGCEIEIFSKDPSSCHRSSLTVKGYLVPESLTPFEVRISVKGAPKIFKFNELRMKFEN